LELVSLKCKIKLRIIKSSCHHRSFRAPGFLIVIFLYKRKIKRGRNGLKYDICVQNAHVIHLKGCIRKQQQLNSINTSLYIKKNSINTIFYLQEREGFIRVVYFFILPKQIPSRNTFFTEQEKNVTIKITC
jgi:hypothetical protein